MQIIERSASRMFLMYLTGIILTHKIFKFFTWPLFWWKSLRKKIAVSHIDEPLLLLSATTLARKIRERRITSAQLIRASIKRINEVNPKLNAVVEDRFEDAIEEAKKIDEYISNSDLTEEELRTMKPLLGLPVTVKGSCAVQGLSHSVGSLKRIGIKAQSDCAAVEILRKAGAIPLLVSNTPELCLSWDTTNHVTGPTCNPYNLNRSAGGSSGGEAALVAAGASIIGIGTDAAGSLRVPAMFDGVFAHKMTPGFTSLDGHFPISADENCFKFCVMGPITRYAEDLELVTAALCGDMSKELKLNETVDVSSLTIYHMDEVPGHPFMIPVQQDIKDAIAKAVSHLSTVCHCKISDYKFTGMKHSFEISASQFLSVKDMPNILKDEEDPKKDDNLYLEIVKNFLGISKYTRDALMFYFIQRIATMMETEKSFVKCVKVFHLLQEEFSKTLNTTGVLIYPTFPTSAYLHGEILTEIIGITYAMIFNILGLPATHVPLGLDKDGLPIGFQIVAAPNQDRLCIAVAKELEKQFGGWLPPQTDNFQHHKEK